MNAAHNLFDCLFGVEIIGHVVAHIYEGYVSPGYFAGLSGTVQAVSFATASAHLHTVNGLLQPPFGHGDDEAPIASAIGACSPNGPPWIGHNMVILTVG